MRTSNKFKSEEEKFYDYLKHNLATVSMVEEATGIKQKNGTRYKRNLEKLGLLWKVKKTYCKHTGRIACYISSSEEFKPKEVQLNIFE